MIDAHEAHKWSKISSLEYTMQLQLKDIEQKITFAASCGEYELNYKLGDFVPDDIAQQIIATLVKAHYTVVYDENLCNITIYWKKVC